MSARVLIVRFSAIGDCVMTAWAVTALRQSHPSARIVWAVQERCAPVIDDGRLANRVVLADMDDWRKRRWSPATWRAQLATFTRLRAEKFDVGFDFQGHSKTAICLRLSGAKERLAGRATDGLAGWLNQVVKECDAGGHEVERAMRLVSARFAVTLPDRPIMPQVGGTLDPKLVTIQTGAGGKGKAYPIESFQEVAKELVRLGHRVVGLGGPRDPELQVPGAEDRAGKASLRDSMALVAASRLHLASDTGTGHIAAAYGVPVVSVFGPMPADRYRPFTDRGIVLDRGPDPAAVPVADVLHACQTLLEAPA